MDIKDKIIKSSLKIFNEKGFHGASMRDIAKDVNCSLPTLYYYFKNKNDLFEEVAIKEFLRLVNNLHSSLDINSEPEELYTKLIIMIKNLNKYDKMVYKIALKIQFGFDGTADTQKKLFNWEEEIKKMSLGFLKSSKYSKSIGTVFVTMLVNVCIHLIEKIIILNEDISEEDIKEQINLLFGLVK